MSAPTKQRLGHDGQMTSVYFIQAGDENGPVKVGYSADPAKRVVDLQTGNHLKLTLVASVACSNAPAGEEFLHQHLDLHDARIQGEWFECDDKMRALIRAAKAFAKFRADRIPSLDDVLPKSLMMSAFSGIAFEEMVPDCWVAEWSHRQGAGHVDKLTESLSMAWQVLLGGGGHPTDYVILGFFPTQKEAHAFMDLIEPHLRAMRLLRLATGIPTGDTR